MSTSSQQICLLYDAGMTPEQIAENLSFDITDVLLILNSTGKLNKKGIASNIKLQAILTGGVDKPVNNAPYEPPAQHASKIDSQHGIKEKQFDESLKVVEEQQAETVEQIYEKYKVQIAKTICNFATSEPSNELPAGVIAKCAMYAQEEFTGRNEAKAKKGSNNSLLVNIAELMRQARIADQRVNDVLSLGEEERGMKQLTVVNV